jgi:hypothetical protein
MREVVIRTYQSSNPITASRRSLTSARRHDFQCNYPSSSTTPRLGSPMVQMVETLGSHDMS